MCVFIYHAQLCLFPGYEVKDYNTDNVINTLSVKSVLLNFLPFSFGWTGVELFLLISGFLIHLGFLRSDTKLNLFTFYSKRFWRIYPPYLVILLFFVFAKGGSLYLSNKEAALNLLSHLFFVHNLFDKFFFKINGSYWSLALEMQLYLIYPLLLFLRKKSGIKNAFLIILLISILLFVPQLLSPVLMQSLAYGTFVIKYWFIWVAGAFFAEKYFSGEKLFGKWVKPIIAIGFILTFIFKINLYSSYLIIYSVTFTWLAVFEWILHTKSINTKSYACKTLTTIGICSYSIYLIHQPYLSNLIDYFHLLPFNHYAEYFKIFNIIPTFIIIFLISYSLFQLIELPSIKYGADLRNKKTTEF